MRRLVIAGITGIAALTGCALPFAARHQPASAPRSLSSANGTGVRAEAERFVRPEHVQEVVRRFTNDIRFRQFDSAVGFVEPDLRPQFRAATDQLQTIRFTGVTVEQVELDADARSAVATVRWRGHWLQSPFERELRTTQRWRRDAERHTWYVTPELEALGVNLEQLRATPPASMSPR
jgi:hypothetical protein